MNPLQPLMTLLTQCERERDELAVACQRAVMSHRSATAQAEQLVVYRGEYEQRWTTQFKTDGRMELVNCYRGFMDRLTQAVEQQQRVVAHALAALDQARLKLRDGEIRVASVRKLIERRQAEARLSADRREQKNTDEFAQRAAWNRQRDSDRADAF
jgi:flagellar FliJ protein